MHTYSILPATPHIPAPQPHRPAAQPQRRAARMQKTSHIATHYKPQGIKKGLQPKRWRPPQIFCQVSKSIQICIAGFAEHHAYLVLQLPARR